MDPRYQLERAMDRLDEEYERGDISAEAHREEMRHLQAEYRDCAAEAAQEEYDSWF